MGTNERKEGRNRSKMDRKATVLGIRELNRALLARQMLLKREKIPALDAINRLVGMQAQDPIAPYFGLMARLEEFRPEELSSLIQDRKVVRIALMRSTIHLVSSGDCINLRPIVQPVMDGGLKGSFGKQLEGLDIKEVSEAGRIIVEANPLTFSDLGKRLREQWPDRDPAALAAVVRTLVPLVQLPPRGLWGESGQAVHTSAESWHDSQLSSSTTIEDIIIRYLSAFGPASVQDIQVWSGLTRLRERVEQLLTQLLHFQDEKGNELFDIPEAPRPDSNTPSPPRFLGGFDNMLLSYADRQRIIAEEYRKKVFSTNGIIRPTILIDGFVSGTWKINRKRGMVILIIELFNQLSNLEHNSLVEEGERLLSIIAKEEDSREIVFV